jgi:apolipoprotein N-acyltransferase
MSVSHLIAVISLIILAHPIADLELGVALVELCVAVEEFKERRRYRGCLSCLLAGLSFAIAISAWLAVR